MPRSVTSWPSCGRARCSRRWASMPRRPRSPGRCEGAAHARRTVDVRYESHAARCSASRTPSRCRGSASTHWAAAVVPAGACAGPAIPRRPISRTSATSRSRNRRSSPRTDAAQSRGDSKAADGGRTGSLLHEIDRTITPTADARRAWRLRPLISLERFRIGWTRSKTLPSARRSGPSSCETLNTSTTSTTPRRARRARHRRSARPGVAPSSRFPAVPCWVRMPARAVPGAAGRARCLARRSPTLRDALERTLPRAAGHRARRRYDPRWRRRRARRFAPHQPAAASSASPRWRKPSARAPDQFPQRFATTASSGITSKSRSRTSVTRWTTTARRPLPRVGRRRARRRRASAACVVVDAPPSRPAPPSTSSAASARAVSWIRGASAATRAAQRSNISTSRSTMRSSAPSTFSSYSFNAGVMKRSPPAIVCLR